MDLLGESGTDPPILPDPDKVLLVLKGDVVGADGIEAPALGLGFELHGPGDGTARATKLIENYFIKDMDEIYDEKITIGKDGFLISMPSGSTIISTKDLFD